MGKVSLLIMRDPRTSRTVRGREESWQERSQYVEDGRAEIRESLPP